MYCLDWDNIGRVETIQMLDDYGNVLDTRTVSGFSNGLWLVWNVRGHVQLRVTRAASTNAVIGGLFFGAPN